MFLLGIFLTSVFLYPASSQNNLSYFLFIEIKNLLVIFVFLFFTGLLLEIVSNSKLFSILSNKEIESISSNAKIKLIYKIIISFLLSILLIRKIVCGFFISKIELCENLNFCYFICYLYYYFSKIILFIFITIYLISPLLRLRIKFLTFYQFLAFIISIWTFSFPF